MSSKLVSRSRSKRNLGKPRFRCVRGSSSHACGDEPPAWWQSGHAAACKAVYAGSIPTQASISNPRKRVFCCLAFAPRGAAMAATRLVPSASRVARRRWTRPRPDLRRLLRGMPVSEANRIAPGVMGPMPHRRAPRLTTHRTPPPGTATACFSPLRPSGTLPTYRPGGETGRRKGLKIPRPSAMRVRVPPRAPMETMVSPTRPGVEQAP